MASLLQKRPGAVYPPSGGRKSTRNVDDEEMDESAYTAPLTPPVSPKLPKDRRLGIRFHEWLWPGFSLFILCSILIFMPSLKKQDRSLRPIKDLNPIGPDRVSKIPPLYTNIVYNHSKGEGNIFRGDLDPFPGDSHTVNRRFVTEMPDFAQRGDFSEFFEELHRVSARLAIDYAHYYVSIHKHMEDAITLTNAVIEDLVNVAGGQLLGIPPTWLGVVESGHSRTQNFREWIGKNSLWSVFIDCKSDLELARAIYIQYLRALREGYKLHPNSGVSYHKTIGFLGILKEGQILAPKFEKTKNITREIRSIVELGINASLSGEFPKRPAFVPPSKSQIGKAKTSDTIGYMKHWLENDFATGQHVREVKLPNFVRQYQEDLTDIELTTRKLLNILSSKENRMDGDYPIQCHIKEMHNALESIISHHRFDVSFPHDSNSLTLMIGDNLHRRYRTRDRRIERYLTMCP